MKTLRWLLTTKRFLDGENPDWQRKHERYADGSVCKTPGETRKQTRGMSTSLTQWWVLQLAWEKPSDDLW